MYITVNVSAPVVVVRAEGHTGMKYEISVGVRYGLLDGGASV